MKSFSWLLLFVVPMIAGCAPTVWTRISEPVVMAPDKSFSIELPVGWVRADFKKGEIYVIKDGSFQAIEVRRLDHENALENIKTSTSAQLLPTELADLLIASLNEEAQQSKSALTIVSNQPAIIAGQQGLRLHFQIKTPIGLRVERIVYGFVTQQGFFQLTYQAPTLHYFERDLPAFEQSVRSMRLMKST